MTQETHSDMTPETPEATDKSLMELVIQHNIEELIFEHIGKHLDIKGLVENYSKQEDTINALMLEINDLKNQLTEREDSAEVLTESTINRSHVRLSALEAGFKLKRQQEGNMDLNSYVFDFAERLLAPLIAHIQYMHNDLEAIKSSFDLEALGEVEFGESTEATVEVLNPFLVKN